MRVSKNALHVIDPCGGMSDLAAGLLQFPSEKVVCEDPVASATDLQICSAVRFQNIPKRNTSGKKSIGPYFLNIAAERCSDELMKILKVKRAHLYLQQMEAVGLLTQVVPAISKSWSSLETFEETPIPGGTQHLLQGNQ